MDRPMTNKDEMPDVIYVGKLSGTQYLGGYAEDKDLPNMNTKYTRADLSNAWQDISSAPRDGTPFTAWWPKQYHFPVVIFWADKWSPWTGCTINIRLNQPTGYPYQPHPHHRRMKDE